MKTSDQLEPPVFVIFGGAGDLTWWKLIPALFDLTQDRSVPVDFAVTAVDRIASSDEKLHPPVASWGKPILEDWKSERRRIESIREAICQQDFEKLGTYAALGAQCAGLEKAWGFKVHRIY